MEDLRAQFTRLDELFSDPEFLRNRGFQSEVGVHIFCYDPGQEALARELLDWLRHSKNYHIVERNLYEIFLEICKDKGILSKLTDMERRKGSAALLKMLEPVARPEAFVSRMRYNPHERGDILLITGVGDVWPFTRAHNILNNLGGDFSDIPVVLFYPGRYNGSEFSLFGEFEDGNYYRGFNLLK